MIVRFRKRSAVRRFGIFSVLVLTSMAPSVLAQTPNQTHGNLGAVLETSAQKVLSTCQSWPPELATRPGDQSKQPHSKGLVDGTSLVTTQLASVLSLDPNVQPYEYDASFLRMMDSVGTFEPAVPNDQLLGIALNTDPNQLHLWGTDLSTVKYDCMSMLSLLGQGSGNYAIPFFSLNGAFKASQSVSSNQTSTFLFGTFQSPFDYLYHSQDQAQRLFAGLKAMDWRLKNSNASQDQYVATTHLLAISKDYLASENTSLLGSMKAGSSFSIANLSGNLSGQFAASLQANSESYITYFWLPTMRHIADLPTLSGFVISNLPQLDPKPTELRAEMPVQATAEIVGWPGDLCSQGAWTLKAQNDNFTPLTLSMDAAPAVSGLPVCKVVATFSESAAVAANKPARSSLANPQLSLQNRSNTTVNIPLSLSQTLTPSGESQATAGTVPARWNSLTNHNNQATDLFWTVPGHVDVPNGRRISSMQVRASDFSCKISDTSSLPITGVLFEGAASSSPQTKSGPDSSFNIDVMLTLQGAPSYNDDINQQNKRTCSIDGVVQVTTTNSAGADSLTESAGFKTNLIYYPNELVAPVVPANVSVTGGNSQVLLSWTASSGAASYNIYRGTAAGAEIPIKTGVTVTNYSDTSLTNGATYFYQVSAVNTVGESARSAEVNAAPHN